MTMNAVRCQIWHRRGEASIQQNKLSQGIDIIKVPVNTMFKPSLSHHHTSHSNWFAECWQFVLLADRIFLSNTPEITWHPTPFHSEARVWMNASAFFTLLLTDSGRRQAAGVCEFWPLRQINTTILSVLSSNLCLCQNAHSVHTVRCHYFMSKPE